jgi:Flp pilus assembly pilin Flp
VISGEFSTGEPSTLVEFNRRRATAHGGHLVKKFFAQLWSDERGQDIAEYAVMLAVILVIVVGTIRLIGSNANNVFSQVSSAIPQ